MASLGSAVGISVNDNKFNKAAAAFEGVSVEAGTNDREEEIARRFDFGSTVNAFWRAKYRCILMAAIVFFSILEIFLLHFNTFVSTDQGKNATSILIKEVLNSVQSENSFTKIN